MLGEMVDLKMLSLLRSWMMAVMTMMIMYYIMGIQGIYETMNNDWFGGKKGHKHAGLVSWEESK